MSIVRTALIMGMPVSIQIADMVEGAAAEARQVGAIEGVFEYFRRVDRVFSTYKEDSEISRINGGELSVDAASPEVKEVLRLCQETHDATGGYFEINGKNGIDPSGLVKGWAIRNGAEELKVLGYQNLCVEIGGDIQVFGHNSEGQCWKVGIRNPFNPAEIIKVLHLSDRGIATSGTYLRGEHIWDPVRKRNASRMASLTVIGPDVYEADRFVTAAFAMGEAGLGFIDSMEGFAGYMVTNARQGYASGAFEPYTTE